MFVLSSKRKSNIINDSKTREQKKLLTICCTGRKSFCYEKHDDKLKEFTNYR